MRFNDPGFFMFALTAVLFAGFVGCVGMALSAQTAATDHAGIISVTKACSKIERAMTRGEARPRVLGTFERVHANDVTVATFSN